MKIVLVLIFALLSPNVVYAAPTFLSCSWSVNGDGVDPQSFTATVNESTRNVIFDFGDGRIQNVTAQFTPSKVVHRKDNIVCANGRCVSFVIELNRVNLQAKRITTVGAQTSSVELGRCYVERLPSRQF